MMLETYSTSSQVKIMIMVQVNNMKIERKTNPRNLRNSLITKEWTSATISRQGTSISMVVLIEVGAVETEAIDEEMAVVAVVMMKGKNVEIVEEVGVEDAVTTVLNIKNKKNISSRMIIEMEVLSTVLELIAPQKLSFTIIRPMKKSSP